MKRSSRTDKKKYVEDLSMATGEAAREGNMRQLHYTRKKLIGKYNKAEGSFTNKEGKPVTENQEQ